MMRSLNIRWRLTLWYGCVLAVVLTGFGAATFFAMRYQLLERIDSGLREELADVASEIRRGKDRTSLLAWLHRRFGQHAGFDFQITAENGERIFSNPRLGDGRFPAPGRSSARAQIATVELAPSQKRYRLISQQIEGPSGRFLAQVGRPLDAYDHELSELLMVLWTAGASTLAVALGGGYFLAKRALAPVDHMTVSANQIDARRLDQRLEVVNSNDELGRLAQTLNSMLDRLQRTFIQIQRFTADASHELRTPLSVIRMEAEMALQKPLGGSEKQELLSNILEECQRLTWITDQLLTLSREDTGITQLTRKPVDMGALARGVTETMRPLAASRRQALRVSVEGPCTVQGDIDRLRHVIYNLLDNAIKYTPEGGSTELAVQRNGSAVVVTVRDTGIGIPAEHLPHVFDRFYRVDKARSRAQGGSGLGLSIVQSIVAAHEGEVTVESQTGVGTTVRVRLPAVPNEA